MESTAEEGGWELGTAGVELGGSPPFVHAAAASLEMGGWGLPGPRPVSLGEMSSPSAPRCTNRGLIVLGFQSCNTEGQTRDNEVAYGQQL